jgi:hypothetical protein
VQLFSDGWVDSIGRNARLLDDARLVDAWVQVAGRCIRGTRTSRDEAARHDRRREGGSSTVALNEARLRSLTLQLRFDQKNFGSISPTAC